jgi:hypothetical protein
MKSIRCLLGSHSNPGTSESRLTFCCGRCGRVVLRSVDEVFAVGEEEVAFAQARAELRASRERGR